MSSTGSAQVEGSTVSQNQPEQRDLDAVAADAEARVEGLPQRKQDEPVEPRSKVRQFASALAEVVVVIIATLMISGLLQAFVAQMFVIPSPSMESTLGINDRVMVSKVSDHHRGDIIVFEDPAHWLGQDPERRTGVGALLETMRVLPSTSTNHLVKRLIGLPGDHVVCCDAQGRMSVNGKALDETEYLHIADGVQAKPSNFNFDVVVPAGRVFVMGDNRDHSGDSRCHLRDISNDGQPQGMGAFVRTEKIVGPVVAIVAPFDRWRRFSVPGAFGGVPDPAPAPTKPSISITNPDC